MMNETTKLQEGVLPVQPDDYLRVVEVWESSVRATHHFVAESDIQIFKPMVRDVLQHLNLACMRDIDGEGVGFTAVTDGNVHMLLLHADWRGQGVGGRLLRYAVASRRATALDANEQNAQALGF